jgi:hypothetical protein
VHQLFVHVIRHATHASFARRNGCAKLQISSVFEAVLNRFS